MGVMGYYCSALITPFAATWTDLEVILLSEASQRKIPYNVWTPRSEFGGIIALCRGLHSKGTPTSKHPITKLQTIIAGTTGSPNNASALVTG